MFDLKISEGFEYLVGSDEVGRGCLAGPVVCCSVIVDGHSNLKTVLKYLKDLRVTDSKKLSPKKMREINNKLFGDCFCELVGKAKISNVYNYYNTLDASLGLRACISTISPKFIDNKNILNASLYGMRTSGEKLVQPISNQKGIWLVDGNAVWRKSKSIKCDVIPVISGDSKSLLIGASSIIAKDFRDSLMKRVSIKYPGYGLDCHFGYPTKHHKSALKKLGSSPIHRKSFRGVTQ